MNIRFGTLIAALFIIANTQALAQSAGSAVSLQYGTVASVEQVKAAPKHARGGLLGGVAGAVLANGHPGLGAVAGGLIGGSIEGHRTGKQVLQQYSVALNGGGALVIDTEQHDIVVGDCVMVEDKDGHCVMLGARYELMNGACVRILIRPDVERAELVAMLEKAVECAKRGSVERLSFSNGIFSFSDGTLPEECGDDIVPF